MSHDVYQSPLCGRYADSTMQHIFSPTYRIRTWRRLWVALAEAQQEAGLAISDDQIHQMQQHIDDIDWQAAEAYEHRTRHDVMAHVLTYGDACPLARPIIHLGATSCYVGDNADIIIMRDAMLHIRRLLVNTLDALRGFALQHKDLACLAYTHYQAAQPTTMGKRATLWAQDLLMDLERLDYELEHLSLLGCKGTTGTAASFLALLKDKDLVEQVERSIADKMDFARVIPVSGQTYTRKVDSNILYVMASIATSASKMANDVRLLMHDKEVDEPMEMGQIGSSAMAYKRNPMRCERINSLARYVLCDTLDPMITASTQWLERTLDDSAGRRIAIPEAFLAVDGILLLYYNIIKGLVVYPKTIAQHLATELPFMATENILMAAVAKGGDRQTVHEAIRVHARLSGNLVKQEGAPNDLLQRLAQDASIGLSAQEIADIVDVQRFVGLAPNQTEDFVHQYLDPVLARYSDLLGDVDGIKV